MPVFSCAYSPNQDRQPHHGINQAISSSPSNDKIKNNRIDSIKLVLKNSGNITQSVLFNLFSQLYSEYQIYNYDSAFSYAQKMVSEGQSMHEDSLVGYKNKNGFCIAFFRSVQRDI